MSPEISMASPKFHVPYRAVAVPVIPEIAEQDVNWRRTLSFGDLLCRKGGSGMLSVEVYVHMTSGLGETIMTEIRSIIKKRKPAEVECRSSRMKKMAVHWLAELRKHIVWRVFIGTMACIGGMTTIASLQNDIIRPLLFPRKELRREIELEQLIRTFTPDSDGEPIDWTTGAALDSPIEWVSSERYGDTPDTGFLAKFSVARHGQTTVMIDGKPAHEQFDEFLHPAVWDVSLYGCMAGISCIQFSSYGSGYNKGPDIIKALTGFAALELKESHPMSGGSLIQNLYHVSIPGKKETWLVESWSKGNHMWIVSLTVFPEAHSHTLARECLLSPR